MSVETLYFYLVKIPMNMSDRNFIKSGLTVNDTIHILFIHSFTRYFYAKILLAIILLSSLIVFQVPNVEKLKLDYKWKTQGILGNIKIAIFCLTLYIKLTSVFWSEQAIWALCFPLKKTYSWEVNSNSKKSNYFY